MVEIPVVTKLVEGAFKLGQHFKDKKEEERMRTIADQLRRTTQANAGNCLKPKIGSDDDRLYSKMVTKGYLVRVPFGYMLPEFGQHRHGSLY